MTIGSFDTDKKIFIVAEVGNNHEGKFALAKELIHRAKDAGADAVKFQTFRTELFVSHKDAARFARLKSFELTFDQFAELSAVAREVGIIFLSTPLDLESAAFLNRIVAAFKIASGDNTFYPLIEAVAETGKPMIVSSGMATITELERVEALVNGVWKKNGIMQELAILHCVASYPAPPESANLGAIRHLQQALHSTIGYSDHTIGIDAAVVAAALGARIIEKHFTIDKQYSDFRDHQLSADPTDLAALVARVRAVEVVLGDGTKKTEACEQAGTTAFRRSIVAARDLPIGTVVATDDIIWVRPAGGLAPGNERAVVGKKTIQAIPKGDFLLSHLVT